MWKLSFRSLCNDSCVQWVKCLLTAASFVLFPFPLYPLLFFIALFLHFSFIIFNGCFVRRLTFYCYLMKWVWFTSWYIYLVRTLNVGTSNTHTQTNTMTWHCKTTVQDVLMHVHLHLIWINDRPLPRTSQFHD